MDVKKYLLKFKKRFDPKLDRFLLVKQKLAKNLAPGFEQAITEIRRFNQAGGKRIRPAMIYTGFKACGEKENQKLWRACMAMELIQAFALLHDDIMDDDQKRRGEITCFKKMGLNKAILVGDVALILADELIPQEAKKYFDLMKWELAAGQWLDVSNEDFKKQNEKLKFKILELKTAMYAVARPLQIGAVLAGTNQPTLNSFYQYGKKVGTAFQMKDDVLDKEVKPKDLAVYLFKAKEFSQKGKKIIKDVKIGSQEKEFLMNLADYVVERRY